MLVLLTVTGQSVVLAGGHGGHGGGGGGGNRGSMQISRPQTMVMKSNIGQNFVNHNNMNSLKLSHVQTLSTNGNLNGLKNINTHVVKNVLPNQLINSHGINNKPLHTSLNSNQGMKMNKQHNLSGPFFPYKSNGISSCYWGGFGCKNFCYNNWGYPCSYYRSYPWWAYGYGCNYSCCNYVYTPGCYNGIGIGMIQPCAVTAYQTSYVPTYAAVQTVQTVQTVPVVATTTAITTTNLPELSTKTLNEAPAFIPPSPALQTVVAK